MAGKVQSGRLVHWSRFHQKLLSVKLG